VAKCVRLLASLLKQRISFLPGPGHYRLELLLACLMPLRLCLPSDEQRAIARLVLNPLYIRSSRGYPLRHLNLGTSNVIEG
jgi:hypothetical protein